MSNFLKSLIMAFFAATMLSACGGGSGSETDQTTLTKAPTPSPPTSISVDVSTSDLTVNEGDTDSVEISTNYNGKKALTFSVSVDGSSGVQASVSADQITVFANLVTSLNESAVLTLNVTDGDVSTETDITIAIENTSFWETHSDLVNKSMSLQNFANKDESSHNVIVFLTDVDYRAGFMGKDMFETEIISRTNAVAGLNASLSGEALEIIDTLNNYTNSSSGNEADLKTIVDLIEDITDVYAATMADVYKAVKSTGRGVLPELVFSELSQVDGVYSLFVGNSAMGSITGDTWTFSEDYRFLEPVINTSVCYAL